MDGENPIPRRSSVTEEEEMRNLGEVLDEIFSVAPDLKPEFHSLLSSLSYTAPEMIHIRWNEAAHILNVCASEHPQKEKISKIFSGVA